MAARAARWVRGSSAAPPAFKSSRALLAAAALRIPTLPEPPHGRPAPCRRGPRPPGTWSAGVCGRGGRGGRIRPWVSEDGGPHCALCCGFLHHPVSPRTAVPPPPRRLLSPQPCPKSRVPAGEVCLGESPPARSKALAVTATRDVRVAMQAVLGKKAGGGISVLPELTASSCAPSFTTPKIF